nr:hybrid signal transduction histidine kinase M [Tanacetum cinerariifolium]
MVEGIWSALGGGWEFRLVVEDPQTTKEAWDLIVEILNDNKSTHSITLKSELHSLKLCDLSIDSYFYKIESIATLLTSLGSPISNDDVVTIALELSPDRYENVFGIIFHWEPFPDLKTVRSMLTTEEMQLKSRAQATSIDSSSSSHMVLLSNSCNTTRRPTVTSGYNENINATASTSNANSVTMTPLAFHTRPVQPLVGFSSPPGFSQPKNGLNLFVHDNHCTVEFDAFDFSVKDFRTGQVLLRCDSTGDLYPVTKPSIIPHAFLTGQYAWHQRLGHC